MAAQISAVQYGLLRCGN